MSAFMYGIVTHTGECVPVSNTERGAKSYATRHGYTSVYSISNHSWTCTELAKNINGKWVKV